MNPEKPHAATKFVGDFSVVVLFYFFNVLIRPLNKFKDIRIQDDDPDFTWKVVGIEWWGE